MKIFGTNIKNLEDLFIMQMQYLYDMESEIIDALPKMIKAATDPELEQGLKDHLEETKGQKARIEEIFSLIDEKPSKKTKSEAIRGLIKDGKDIVSEDPDSELLDAGIVASCRDIEYAEIAEYMNAIDWANALGHKDAVKLLKASLKEEMNAAKTLSEANPTILERAQESVIGDEDDDEDDDA